MPADTTPPFAWTDAYELGYPPMDQTHQEFVDVVGRLQHCADDALLTHLREFAAHTRSHFGAEDSWMRETDFPARDCHIDEHAAVMRSVEQVIERVAAGDFEPARRLADELAKWFPGHADYLDSALAHWMCKRRFGGKPVVLRRTITASGRPLGSD
jgi:hemerythrin-like metal-binding protein